jgi:protein required for attachment to host cells
MRRVRIVVADQCQARFLDSVGTPRDLQHAGVLLDPAGRQHEQEFGSGRAGSGVGGGHGHYALQHRSSRKEHEVELFAHEIAAQLTVAANAGEYDDLAIVAAPHFLGVLRKALSPALHNRVKHEIHHDLVHQSDEVIRAHLPEHW